MPVGALLGAPSRALPVKIVAAELIEADAFDNQMVCPGPDHDVISGLARQLEIGDPVAAIPDEGFAACRNEPPLRRGILPGAI